MEKFNIQKIDTNLKKDLYREWQKTMIREGHLDANKINEISYINYVINESNNIDDFNKALSILRDATYSGRKDLIASVYIKMGDYEEAQRIIENVKDTSLYKEMAVCLKELSEKSPETVEIIMEHIKENNSDYFNKLNSN